MGTFPRSMNFPGFHMRIGITCFVFLLARCAAAEDSLHVYYYGGEAIEQMNIGGVTVTLTLKDTGRLNQVAVYVDNRSSESVNVIPANITLHQNAPKDKGLAAKSDQEVQKIGGHSAVGQVVNELGTGLSRAKDKLSGKEDASSGKASTDYDAQARWLAHAGELAHNGQTVTLARSYPTSTTEFPPP